MRLDSESVDEGKQCAVLLPGGLVGVRIDDDEAGQPVSLVVEVGQLGLDAEPGGVWVGGGSGNGATLSISAAAVVSRSASSVRYLAV